MIKLLLDEVVQIPLQFARHVTREAKERKPGIKVQFVHVQLLFKAKFQNSAYKKKKEKKNTSHCILLYTTFP